MVCGVLGRIEVIGSIEVLQVNLRHGQLFSREVINPLKTELLH